MRNVRRLVVDVPEWFNILRSDAQLTSKDVAEIFGFASVQSVHASVRDGCFPKADYTHHGYRLTTARWFKSTIVKEIKRRKALKEEEQ